MPPTLRAVCLSRHLVAAMLCAFAAASMVARAQQTPTFRGGVTLIPVDVSVLDRDGKPVAGLTAADFEIKLDGRAQPVRVVNYEQVSTVAPPPTSAAPGRELNNATLQHDPRIFVVLIDDLSMTPHRGKSMVMAAEKFVGSLLLTDIVGSTTTSTSATVNPTRDHAAVQEMIRHAVGQLTDPRSLPPAELNIGLSEGMEIAEGDTSQLTVVIGRECFGGQVPTAQDLAAAANAAGGCPEQVARKARAIGALMRRTEEQQIEAYVGVINAMRWAPGLKHIVVISDGLVVPAHKGLTVLTPIARAAAEAGVQVSVLAEEPEGPSAADTNPAQAALKRLDGQALINGIQTVADLTGGNFHRVIGSPDAAFARVRAASSALYHLGIEAPAGSVPGQDYAVLATVRRSGVTVHANRQAVLPSPADVPAIDDQLRAAVAKGQPLFGVPLTAATVLRRGAGTDQIELGANVEVPASAPGPVTVVFGLVDAAGTLKTGRKTVEAPADGSNYRLSLAQTVPPGKYRLRFAVADAGGRVGSLDAAVNAELAHVGPYLASDVLTSWAGADGKPQVLALSRVPAAAVAVRAFLELYAPPPPAPAPPSLGVKVQWTLVAEDGRTVDTKVVTAAPSTDRLNASAEFSLANVATGSYTIRATVMVDNAAAGTVSTAIRKAP